MRILHLVHQYPPDQLAGTELYTQSLATRQAAAGHHVAVFTPLNQDGPARRAPTAEAGVRVYRAVAGARNAREVFLSTFRQPGLVAELAMALEIERPNIVHLQHLMGLPAAAIDELRRRALPYVITLHDYWFGCANGQLLTNYDNTTCDGPAPDRRNCGRCVLARAGLNFGSAAAFAVTPLLRRRFNLLAPIFEDARRIIAPTDFVRRAHERMGFDPARVVVVGHGTEAPPIAPGHRLPGPLRLGYVGSLSPQKGLHVLIEAVNRLPAEAVTLTLYGNPDVFPDYAAGLRAAAAHPGIRFAGTVGRDALWGRLAELDAIVLPTLWYEASPLVIGEAFAAGLPVVGSRLGSLPELIREGKDGLLFEPGDAAALREQLLALAGDPALLARLRAGVRRPRTMAEHAAAIEDVYDQALRT